jgi:hypothetical protein
MRNFRFHFYSGQHKNGASKKPSCKLHDNCLHMYNRRPRLLYVCLRF